MKQLLRYRNEWIVVFAFAVMLLALGYKNAKVKEGSAAGQEVTQTAAQAEQIVFLREIWADKAIAKKIQSLKTSLPAAKVSWTQKGTRVTATYKGLSGAELNALGKTLLNLGVQIERFEMRANADTYDAELVCKW